MAKEKIEKTAARLGIACAFLFAALIFGILLLFSISSTYTESFIGIYIGIVFLIAVTPPLIQVLGIIFGIFALVRGRKVSGIIGIVVNTMFLLLILVLANSLINFASFFAR